VRSHFEVPDLQVHCKLYGVAEQQIELQSRQLQSLTQFRVDVQTMEPNLSDQCRAGITHATSIEIKLVGVALASSGARPGWKQSVQPAKGRPCL